eukprot:Pgem_evm2s19956
MVMEKISSTKLSIFQVNFLCRIVILMNFLLDEKNDKMEVTCIYDVVQDSLKDNNYAVPTTNQNYTSLD